MGSPISNETAIEISWLMKLFSHPLRVQIVNSLVVDGPASASMLSERFDLTIGDCNYHLGALKDGGVASVMRSRKVRGAKERIYRIEPRSRWPFKPRLHPLITYMVPTTSSASESFLVALPVRLDARGAADAAAAISAARKKAAQIEAASQCRIQDADPAEAINAVLTTGRVDLAKFEAALARGAGE